MLLPNLVRNNDYTCRDSIIAPLSSMLLLMPQSLTTIFSECNWFECWFDLKGMTWGEGRIMVIIFAYKMISRWNSWLMFEPFSKCNNTLYKNKSITNRLLHSTWRNDSLLLDLRTSGGWLSVDLECESFNNNRFKFFIHYSVRIGVVTLHILIGLFFNVILITLILECQRYLLR